MLLLISLPVFRASSGFAKVFIMKTIIRSSFQSAYHKGKALTLRPPVYISDYLTPTPSHLLNITLADVIPRECYPSHFETSDLALPHIPFPSEQIASSSSHPVLPQGHHLVYFSPQVRGRDLLDDGTDPLQSPGPPLVRRMWAGGSLRYPTSITQQLRSNRTRSICQESISGVKHTGSPEFNDEKMFVSIDRHIMTGSEDVNEKLCARNVAVLERRNLVFLPKISTQEARERVERPDKILPGMYALNPRFNRSINTWSSITKYRKFPQNLNQTSVSPSSRPRRYWHASQLSRSTLMAFI
jgi:hypothetical protein